MRALVLFVLAFSAAASCVAASTVTNSVSSVVAITATTNALAAKVSRQQCEAITKSGNRCKRKAVSGSKLCRQHLKIERKGK